MLNQFCGNYTFSILHLFCGSGGSALGFKQAEGEWRGLKGNFHTLAGIDMDPEACRDFEMLTGAPAYQMDLFSRKDYAVFHGHEPPADWQEVLPKDIYLITGGVSPDVVFTSPPCKGFSGLLPKEKSNSPKYQALNRLTVRGIKLILEAFRSNPPGIIMIENVPRITSRGEHLLKQIKTMLMAHGYVLSEGFHDCGELGGLAQHRKRYLLIARHPDKVCAFVYQPDLKRVKTIGEVLGHLPLPDDPRGGAMHRLPHLKWLTWVRLALIPAGGDWRDLNELAGKKWHANAYKIIPWGEPAGTITTGGAPSNGAVTVADPRLTYRESRHPAVYQVVEWNESGPCVTGSRFGSGAPAIADPRLNHEPRHGAFKVIRWDETMTTVVGAARVNGSNGPAAVADPRLSFKDGTHHIIYRVNCWDKPTNTVTGAMRPNNGAICVADPRINCKPRNGSYKVMEWGCPACTVTGTGDIHAGSSAVADPRIPRDWDQPNPPLVVIALDGTWHRPLTTYELAILQGFPAYLPDGRPLALAGNSDARWRERVGNAVPPPAAKAMGTVILQALIQSKKETWDLGCTPLWVMPDSEIEEARKALSQPEG